MKFWTIAATALALAACTPPAAEAPAEPEVQAVAIEAPTGTYALDKNHASLIVRASHFGLSHYTLRFTNLDASLYFNAEDLSQSTLTATAQANSIETDYPGERDFDAELQNSQWFDAATYPTINFTSKTVERTGPNTGRVTGDLVIKGQAHPLTLDVTFNRSYRQHPAGPQISLLGFSARGVVQRSQYGLNVMMPAPGTDLGVSDEVEILIEAEFAGPTQTQVDDRPVPPPVN